MDAELFDPVARGGAVLLDYFREENFAYTLRGWRHDPAACFAASADASALLAERAFLLDQRPDRHLILQQPESGPVIADAARLLGGVRPDLDFSGEEADPGRRLARWGHLLEPDLLLLRRDAGGAYRLVAGAVCFPTFWAPEEKLGLPLAAIHDTVPGLNENLGEKIQRLMERLRADEAWHRINWGLAAGPERNQHPAAGQARLQADTPPEAISLRMEYQSFLPLLAGEGILFTIRIFTFPLPEVRRHPAAPALARQLRTMPDAVARYKGVSPALARAADYLLGG